MQKLPPLKDFVGPKDYVVKERGGILVKTKTKEVTKPLPLVNNYYLMMPKEKNA